MRKFLVASLLVCSVGLVSCDRSAEAPATEAPSAESAQRLRDNNLALLGNLQALKAQIEARKAARVAGRAAVDETEMEMDVNFSTMKAQVKSALEASGACKAWIDFVIDLFDLLEEVMNTDTSEWTESDYMAWEDKITRLFAKALSCLEPLLADVSTAEESDPYALMGSLQAFDKCMCGPEGGSIFGTSAALVYSTYGAPTMGEGYGAPASPGGDTYSAPSSPAGDGYGAPQIAP